MENKTLFKLALVGAFVCGSIGYWFGYRMPVQPPISPIEPTLPEKAPVAPVKPEKPVEKPTEPAKPIQEKAEAKPDKGQQAPSQMPQRVRRHRFLHFLFPRLVK